MLKNIHDCLKLATCLALAIVAPNNGSLTFHREIFENFVEAYVELLWTVRWRKLTMSTEWHWRLTRCQRVMNPGQPVVFAYSARERKSATARFRRRRGVPCKSAQENIEFDVLTAMQWPPSRGRYQRTKLPSLAVSDGDSRKIGVEREGCCRCSVVATAASAATRDRNHRKIELRDSHVSEQQYTFAKQSHYTALHAYVRVNVRRRATRLCRDYTQPGLGKRTRKRKVFFRLDASRRIDVWCYTSKPSFLILRMCSRLAPSRGVAAYSMT